MCKCVQSHTYAMLARYTLSPCVRLSARVGVCLTKDGVMLKRLNIESRKQHRVRSRVAPLKPNS